MGEKSPISCCFICCENNTVAAASAAAVDLKAEVLRVQLYLNALVASSSSVSLVRSGRLFSCVFCGNINVFHIS